MLLQRMPRFPLDDLRQELDQLFGDVVRPFQGGCLGRARAIPAVNLWEDAECVHVDAEVPGWNMSDLEVTVVGSELTIRGSRKTEEKSEATFHVCERNQVDFARLIALPVEIAADKVHAVLKDGVLSIKLPKHPEVQPKRIAIKVQ